MVDYDGLHGGHQCILALLHGVDEALCGVHLLLEEHHGLFRFFRLVGLVLRMFLYHLREVAAHAQLRQIAVVEADDDGSVIVGVYYEIGDDLLQVPSMASPSDAPGRGLSLVISSSAL